MSTAQNRRRVIRFVEHMQCWGIPVTREKLIDMNWPDGKPDPWEADNEADLPEELQDWSQFERNKA
jgi:hypothetical protein